MPCRVFRLSSGTNTTRKKGEIVKKEYVNPAEEVCILQHRFIADVLISIRLSNDLDQLKWGTEHLFKKFKNAERKIMEKGLKK